MDAADLIATYYESLIGRCNRSQSGRPHDLPRNDRIIYYVVSTRCEMDMSGFKSVFDQLLTEDELLFLVDVLDELDSPELANAFRLAHARLAAAGFFDDASLMVSDFDGKSSCGILDDVEEAVRENDDLWEIDEKLVALLPPNEA